MRPIAVSALIIAGALTLSPQVNNSDMPETGLTIRIISPFGFQPRTAEVIMRNQATGEVFHRSFAPKENGESASFRIAHIPIGDYLLEVDVPMLRAGRLPVRVSVKSGEQWVTLCLPLDGSVDTVGAPPNPPELVGVIKGDSLAAALAWIKLVGVYLPESREVQADSSGRFRFPNLPEGLYVVVVTNIKSPPYTQLVRIRQGTNQVELSLPQ